MHIAIGNAKVGVVRNVGCHLQRQGVLIASDRKHRINVLGFNPEDEGANDSFVQGKVMLNGGELSAIQLEVSQVVQAFLLTIYRITKAAFIPRPACQDFRLVFFKDRVNLLRGRRHVTGYFVCVEKKQALVNIGCHIRFPLLLNFLSRFHLPVILIHAGIDSLRGP